MRINNYNGALVKGNGRAEWNAIHNEEEVETKSKEEKLHREMNVEKPMTQKYQPIQFIKKSLNINSFSLFLSLFANGTFIQISLWKRNEEVRMATGDWRRGKKGKEDTKKNKSFIT